jgi:putative DNA primase/helicase
MPGHVATCWPNGSNSWHKADLTPLKGRDVLLWPDNDVSGTACMETVADKLREIGAASVRVIALEVFKRKPTLKNGAADFSKGGQWDDGDDAADALAKGWTAPHFTKLKSSGELFGLVVEKSEPEQAKANPEPKCKSSCQASLETKE